ncbi:phosphomannomutase/phosphoglucomutase [Marinagarivorans algicola]|uniref:phosphomannomutase/phosphoglucomutase n=1 Tax=Marinagarivorans algicola TaxID=1513270 RepID=UPI0006B45A3F|nr:phosphomannomutase/phosphoglucomutase [Marinagarivorans algicola]
MSVSPASESQFSPVKMWLTGSLLVATIICSSISYFFWHALVVSEQDSQRHKFSQQYLTKASSNISGHLLSLNKKLMFFGQNTQLTQAFKHEDQRQLRSIRLNIMNSLPEAESIRLIPFGKAKLNLDAQVPLRFSDMEIIQRIENREAVQPEAVKLKQGWRLSFAVPIPSDPSQPVAGTLLVTAHLDRTFEAMTQGLENVGKFTLLQTYKGGQHRLFSQGEGQYLPPASIAIKGTPWIVEYIASKNITQLVDTNWVIFAISACITWIVGIALAISLGLFIGLRDERKRAAIAKTYQRMGTTVNQSTTPTQRSLDTDILDITIDEDDDLLGFNETPVPPEESDQAAGREDDASATTQATPAPINQVPSHIFRAYDIRGLVDNDITIDIAQLIGQALGSEALDLGEDTLIVGRDARTHSPLLTEYLVRGILSTGCHVVNIGTVPTPVVYFATETLESSRSGVMVTASHNGPEYNGFKCVMQGRCRSEEDIQAILARIEQNKFHTGTGTERRHDIINDYIETIFADVALGGDLSVVVDAGNGVTGKIAPRLFEEIGCEVTALNCDLDGTFPNHGPDPTNPKNLEQLIAKVAETKADFGVAFDGDGDRLVVITNTGKIIWPDRLLMLFAKDILSRNPGADVVYDVKCTRSINAIVTQFGGRPIMWKTGHAPMKAKIAETGALLGGEYSGHIFIKERWFGFDDGIYVAARLAEIVSLIGDTLDNIFEEFPELPHTNEILVPSSDGAKFGIIEALKESADFKEAKITTLDGIRVDFAYGWGIVRASNTSPNLTLRAEAQNDAQLHDIKALLTRELRKIDTALTPKW